ncbi:hypothetical protein F4803DRAFT_544179, partial [Xylaria telfairii]
MMSLLISVKILLGLHSLSEPPNCQNCQAGRSAIEQHPFAGLCPAASCLPTAANEESGNCAVPLQQWHSMCLLISYLYDKHTCSLSVRYETYGNNLTCG